MDAALQKQLGELLLSAVPTIILFALLFWAYTVMVHRPLMKVLAERHSKTEGAVAKAQSDIAAAEAKTAEYEQRLREARNSIFKAQEARRKLVLEARSEALAEARKQAEATVKVARQTIEKEALDAKSGLPAQIEALAQEVIENVLRTSPVVGGRP